MDRMAPVPSLKAYLVRSSGPVIVEIVTKLGVFVKPADDER